MADLVLRNFPKDLRRELESAAKCCNRSLTEEILVRLRASFGHALRSSSGLIGDAAIARKIAKGKFPFRPRKG